MTNDNVGASDTVSADLETGAAPADDTANTVHAGLTKFAEGEEVKLPNGELGKVICTQNGECLVTHRAETQFHEDELTKA